MQKQLSQNIDTVGNEMLLGKIGQTIITESPPRKLMKQQFLLHTCVPLMLKLPDKSLEKNLHQAILKCLIANSGNSVSQIPGMT